MECFENLLYLRIAFIALNGISGIGCVVVILISIFRKVLDPSTMHIIVCMSLNDIIRSCCLILPLYIFNNTLCVFLGSILLATFTSNVLWASHITIILYRIIIRNNAEPHNLKTWTIFSYVISTVIGILPLSTESIGKNAEICMLDDSRTGNIWRFTAIYIPYWMFTILLLLCYIKVYYKVKGKEKNTAVNLIFNRGFVYAFIMMGLILLTTVFRVIQISSKSCLSSNFAVVDELLLSTHGILNTIAFFFNQNIRKAIFRSRSEVESAQAYFLDDFCNT